MWRPLRCRDRPRLRGSPAFSGSARMPPSSAASSFSGAPPSGVPPPPPPPSADPPTRAGRPAPDLSYATCRRRESRINFTAKKSWPWRDQQSLVSPPVRGRAGACRSQGGRPPPARSVVGGRRDLVRGPAGPGRAARLRGRPGRESARSRECARPRPAGPRRGPGGAPTHFRLPDPELAQRALHVAPLGGLHHSLRVAVPL